MSKDWQHHRQSQRLKGYDYTQAGTYFVTLCAHQRSCLFGEVRAGKMYLNAAGMMVQAEWENLPNRFPVAGIAAFVVMPNHFHALLCLAASEDVVANLSTDAPAPLPSAAVITGRGEPCVRPSLTGHPTASARPSASGHPTAFGCPPTPGHPTASDRPSASGHPSVFKGQTGDSRQTGGEGRTQGSPLPITQIQPPEANRPNGTRDGTIGRIIQAFKSITTGHYIRGVNEHGWPRFNGKIWQRDYYDDIVRHEAALGVLCSYIDSNPANWVGDSENLGSDSVT